jgi:anti-repressor protein
MGLFELKKGVRSGNDGVMKVTMTTKVTGKGQQYFINKFLNQ